MIPKRGQTYFRLGATLYTPCNHSRLAQIVQEGISSARSMVFCLEDAVADFEVEGALQNLKIALRRLESDSAFLRFVRPRNPLMLAQLLQLPEIAKVDGFVLPKTDLDSLSLYRGALNSHARRSFILLPTLETEQVFDQAAMVELRSKLAEWRGAIGCLRIGGNDLMNLLGLKRMPGKTVYETPLGSVIDQLLITFRPHGFELSAPVFDFLDDELTLLREVEHDISYGFFAKTAVHPEQIRVIEQRYAKFVEAHAGQAGAVVNSESAAVFRESGQMMERTCHRGWALRTLTLADSQQVASCSSGRETIHWGKV